MRLILKIVGLVIVNAIALILAARYVYGFSVGGGASGIIILAIIFTILNATLKPILKLLFGPLIILTLGVGLVLVNALLLFLLDFLSLNLMIEGAQALVLATLLISITNFVLHFFVRLFK